MKFLLPFSVCVLLGGIVWKVLPVDKPSSSSVLMDKPAPNFTAVTVEDPSQSITQAIFKNKITLLNVWSTWCVNCKLDHIMWMEIAKKSDVLSSLNVQIIGLNYHDNLQDAREWLQVLGNPYFNTLFDPNGRLSIDYGVYGTPETFIVDAEGNIRYRHVGPINRAIWEGTLLPIIARLGDRRT